MIITVSKKSVTKQMEGLFIIIVNLKCNESGTIVIDRDFPVKYKPGINNIDDKINSVQAEMQKAINDYKAEQQIFRAQQLDNAIITVQGNLVG